MLVSQDPVAAPIMLDRLDGLILSGGGDIVPASYGAPEHETVYGLEPTRDAFEFAIAREALRRRLPMLAICRGMQVLNVALGGTLYVDILDGIEGSENHFLSGDPVYETPVTVDLKEGSRLATLVGTTSVGVNSIHHQSVRDTGDGLSVVGVSHDGVIEAVQHDDPHWPMMAVQWHPEFLSAKADAVALAMFDWLVEAAGGRSAV